MIFRDIARRTKQSVKTVARHVQPRLPRFNRVLEISLDGVRHRYLSTTDFDFAVAARTAVPALRLGELMARPAARLVAEGETLRTLQLKLAGMLDDCRDHGIPLHETLRHTGVMMFSKDHGWRELFRQLLEQSRAGEAYLQVALERYVDYLASRQQVLRAIAALLPAEVGTAEDGAESRTCVYEVPPAAQAAHSALPLRRLPRGRAVRLHLDQGRQLAIRLARYSFALAHDRDWALVADDGRRYTLRPGLNSVGRSRDNSVAVDSGLRNVSRRHLLLETAGEDDIVLTDLSSCGTFVPPTALAS